MVVDIRVGIKVVEVEVVEVKGIEVRV